MVFTFCGSNVFSGIIFFTLHYCYVVRKRSYDSTIFFNPYYGNVPFQYTLSPLPHPHPSSQFKLKITYLILRNFSLIRSMIVPYSFVDWTLNLEILTSMYLHHPLSHVSLVILRRQLRWMAVLHCSLATY